MDTDSVPAVANRPRGGWLRTAVQYAMVVAILIVLGVWMLSAVQKVRGAALRMKTSCHLKCLGLAMHTYADGHKDGHLPGANAPAEEPQGGGKKYPVSWRVLILPYIEEDELFKQYRFDEPWDGPNNIQLLQRMPRTFRHPKADSAQAVECGIVRNVDKTAFARRDAGGYSSFSQCVTEPVGIVTPVGQQGSRLWDRAEQCPRPDVVAGLARR